MSTISELFDLAFRYHQSGNFAQAEPLYRQVLKVDPAHANANHLLGVLAHDTGRQEEAIALIRRAIAQTPSFPACHGNLGLALQAAGQIEEAIASFQQAINLDPSYVNAFNNLGNILKEQGRLDEAIGCYRKALRLNPQYAWAQNNLGNALLAKGLLMEAEECFRQALRLEPANAKAHYHLGNVLKDQERMAEAVDCFRRAVELDPTYTEAQINLGGALFKQGLFAEATLAYDQALWLDPAHPIGRFNRSTLWLLSGDLERGWPGYECRRQRKCMTPRVFAQPRWDGAELRGKTILLYTEQGLGDTILGIRYAPLVKERGGRVLLDCQPALQRLFDGVPGVDQLVPTGTSEYLKDFDVQIPLLSLPSIFRTTLATIPGPVSYLRPEPELVQHWRAELDSLEGFKIGIVWQGNPTQEEDRERSVPLTQFAPLAEIPGVRLISLQVGHGRDQLAQVPFPIIDLGSRLDPNSLHDLAAVLPNLDLVVTVCTSVAHLAGALGVPVWVALKFVPHWCWLLDREDSPWYPTLRLFRQKQYGVWSDVFERIAAEARKLVMTP